MLRRKLTSALYLSFFTVLLFTLWDLYGILIAHQSFSSEITNMTGKTFLLLIPDAWTVTLFAYPIIFLYGVTCSMFSEWATSKMKKGRTWCNLLLHLLFGLISMVFTLGYGLIASLIGVGVDYYLKKRDWKKASWFGLALTVLVILNAIGSAYVAVYSGLAY